jgi:hypothetical protein
LPGAQTQREGGGKFARLNYFVPVPQVKDFDELNAFLAERCIFIFF